jgi:histidyl-tRNA synthetase
MIQSIRGTKDLLPGSIENWQYIEEVLKKISDSYSYNELRTPVFEQTEVFSRSIGEYTDVVNKEMYTFTDRGGDSITLRPEGTAGIVRSVIQNSLLQSSHTLRLWYYGPYFRYERPQKGRSRQFHQYGAECIGTSNPESDVEIISLAADIIKNIGIKNYKLLLNSLGNDSSRSKYIIALTEYLKSSKAKLSQDSRNRLETNPLRILDSKSPDDKILIEKAPIILDFLDEDSKIHFEKVKQLLNAIGIEYKLNPFLVRGLDYYCHTVFEFQSPELGSQDSIGGGGRYDGLFRQLEYKSKVPAVGFAMGIERLLLVLESQKNLPNINKAPDVYIALTNNNLSKHCFRIADILRKKGKKVTYDLQEKSFKAQMRDANRLNASYTIIIGEEELEQEKISIKKMSDSTQQLIDINNIHNFDF